MAFLIVGKLLFPPKGLIDTKTNFKKILVDILLKNLIQR